MREILGPTQDCLIYYALSRSPQFQEHIGLFLKGSLRLQIPSICFLPISSILKLNKTVPTLFPSQDHFFKCTMELQI